MTRALNQRWLVEDRKNTKVLIETDPTSIALIREGDPIRTPEGGVSREGNIVTLPAKERYFGRISSETRIDIRIEGQAILGDYVLVGLHDDDIEQEDRFLIGTRKFHVVWIDPDRSYQVNALVSEDR